MSRTLASDVYGPSMTRRAARSLMSAGRTSGPATTYGIPVRTGVSLSSTVREDAALSRKDAAIVGRAPRSLRASSTVVTPHWFDDRTFADLVGDSPSDMGALIRSARR